MRSFTKSHAVAIAALALLMAAPAVAQRRVPKDLSGVRGFNYMSAPTTGHLEHWTQYSPAETERDLDYAKRLQLNQMRVLIPYQAWAQNKEAFRKNLIDLVRAAHARGIGVMPTLMYGRGMENKDQWPLSREWAADLVATIGKEPGLAFWMSIMSPSAAPCRPPRLTARGWSTRRTCARRFMSSTRSRP